MLYELVYSSVPATPHPSDTLISNILEQARIKNAALGITGLLVYHDNEFAQLLEGEKDAVLGLFSRIEQDSRHIRPYIYWQGQIAQRSFANWHMAYSPLREFAPSGELAEYAKRGLGAFFRPIDATTGRRFLAQVHETMKARTG